MTISIRSKFRIFARSVNKPNLTSSYKTRLLSLRITSTKFQYYTRLNKTIVARVGFHSDYIYIWTFLGFLSLFMTTEKCMLHTMQQQLKIDKVVFTNSFMQQALIFDEADGQLPKATYWRSSTSWKAHCLCMSKDTELQLSSKLEKEMLEFS